VRDHGAVPATICVLNGKAVVGLSDAELEQLADSFGKPGTTKVSRRDLAYVTGLVGCRLLPSAERLVLTGNKAVCGLFE
jgi:pseudouridine-5'-phosphate glycosidase